MRLTGGLFVLVAWTALQLPWERCVSDCHEYLVSAFEFEHEHHDHDCGCHDEHEKEHEEDAEHERVEFDSPRPATQAVVLVALPAVGAVLDAAELAHGTVRVEVVPTAPPERPPRTTVLLL